MFNLGPFEDFPKIMGRLFNLKFRGFLHRGSLLTALGPRGSMGVHERKGNGAADQNGKAVSPKSKGSQVFSPLKPYWAGHGLGLNPETWCIIFFLQD
jgi:hypothetical protein